MAFVVSLIGISERVFCGYERLAVGCGKGRRLVRAVELEVVDLREDIVLLCGISGSFTETQYSAVCEGALGLVENSGSTIVAYRWFKETGGDDGAVIVAN